MGRFFKTRIDTNYSRIASRNAHMLIDTSAGRVNGEW